MNRRGWLIVGILLAVLVVQGVSATTLRINASYNGSATENSNQVYTAMHTDVGDAVSNIELVADAAAHTTTDLFDNNKRGFVTFDGSSIPDNAIISDATVTFTTLDKYNTFAQVINGSLLDATPDNKTLFVATDYNKTTFTRMAPDISLAASPYKFTLNSLGIANISNTTYFTFMVANSADADGANITWETGKRVKIGLRATDHAGIPYITITYTAPAQEAAFTSNVTNGTNPLAVQFNDTTTPTPLTWNWSSHPANLLDYSQDFANGANWGQHKVYVTANTSITDPFGGTGAYQMVSDNITGGAGTNDHYSGSNINTLVKNNTTYTASVYLKAAHNNWSSMTIYGHEYSWRTGFFDIGNGTIGGVISQGGVGDTGHNVTNSIVSAGNGWYRCIITFDSLYGNVTTPQIEIFTHPLGSSNQYTGDNTTIEMYEYGAQFEEGSTATPYIRTTSSAPQFTYFSTDQNATTTFSTAGNYSVHLTITNATGENTTPNDYWIGAYVPTASFTGTPLSGTPGLITTFTDTSTNAPTNRSWYCYGNETESSNTAVASCLFETVGSYNIRLNVSNTAGYDWENKTNYVTIANATVPVTTTTGMSVTGITTAIVAALTLIGIMLIGAGSMMIVRMFQGAGAMGRDGSSSGTTASSMGLGISAIAIGSVLLLTAYIIISPLFTAVGA